MSLIHQPRGLAVCAAFALAAAASAHAQTINRDTESKPAAAAKTAASARAEAQPRIGLITGKINPQPITHADGTVEQELDAGTMSYTVVKRNEDGTLSMVCVTGKDAEAKAIAAKPARTAAVTSKGHSHDLK